MPQPERESLRDLRQAVAQGKLKGTPELCDRLRAAYERERDEYQAANDQVHAATETFMACFCIFAKVQAQALLNDEKGAEASLAEAKAYQARYPLFQTPRIQAIFQELTVLSRGLTLEHGGQWTAAFQTYLPASNLPGDESKVLTGRLAIIELKRGHVDKAQSWAYIHADDPTSQFVLAQIAAQKKNPLVAQRHLTTAMGLLNKDLKDSKEYLPVFYAEAPAIHALSKKLPPLPKPPPPKPAPPPAAPLPPPAPSASADGAPMLK